MTRRISILIAEDDKSFANELSESLKSEGYETIVVHDGSEALKVIRERPIDLGFIDLAMPGVNGMKVLEEATRMAPDVPMIMITGFPTIERAVRATRLGAYDFIEKPATLDRILLTAERALEKRELVQKNQWMAEEILSRYKMVGTSRAMQRVYDLIDKIGPTDSSVLVTGEHGTGKELVARALHMQSLRASAPFIKVNCAAIPDTLIESELFGHKKGAFTNAIRDKAGKFVLADGGTIFLDEIGDMSLAAQAKILRVLQEQEVEAVGDTQVRKIDVRVIAATNKNLNERMESGGFRQDLYFRLSTIEIHLPALRNRKEDIPSLAHYFLNNSCEEHNKYIRSFEPQAMQLLIQYDWPGNVRQLQNIVDRLVILTTGETISANEVAAQLHKSRTVGYPLKYRAAMQEFERQYLLESLIAHNWNIMETARALEIDRTNLYKKMQRLGISRSSSRSSA